jgi:hypothetical protein
MTKSRGIKGMCIHDQGSTFNNENRRKKEKEWKKNDRHSTQADWLNVFYAHIFGHCNTSDEVRAGYFRKSFPRAVGTTAVNMITASEHPAHD